MAKRRRENGVDRHDVQARWEAILWLLLWMMVVWAGPSAADRKASNAVIIHHVDAVDVVALMAERDLLSEVARDREGDPVLRVAMEDGAFIVLFYGCTAHRACQAVQLRAVHRVKPDSAYQRVSEWNQHRRYGRAYVNASGLPTFERLITLQGGVTPGYLRSERDKWLVSVELFWHTLVPKP